MVLALSDQDIVEKLRDGDTSVMKYCYESSFSKVIAMIQKNGGTKQDAEDIFQDTLIVFYKNCLKPTFILSSTISTYVYAIAWRLWMKNIRQAKATTDELRDDLAVVSAFDFELADTKGDQMEEVMDAMEQAGKRCKEILILFYFNKLSMEIIAQKVGLKDDRAVREQKYRCMKRIKDAMAE